jgi:hypothetical protein
VRLIEVLIVEGLVRFSRERNVDDLQVQAVEHLAGFGSIAHAFGIRLFTFPQGTCRHVPGSTELHFYPADLSTRVPVVAAVKAVGFQ